MQKKLEYILNKRLTVKGETLSGREGKTKEAEAIAAHFFS